MTTVVPAPYRVLRRLSRTLYGGIYLCEDSRRAESPVVVKRIELLRAMELLNAPETQEHSVDDPRHEKALANMLQRSGGHPNIVKYHSSMIVGSELFFVMEYCDGGDLFECIQRQERPTVAPMEALAVVAQVSAGVSFLHQHGFAHRDLSLENIFLDRGICKIGDFGLSTRTHQPSQTRVGKAYYMAPEVVRGEPYDARVADMWSVGIVLFIMLTGSPLVPLASPSDRAFMAFRRVGLVAVLESWGVAASMSVEILELLSGLLEVSPAQRLTVDEVLGHRAFVSWTPYAPRPEHSDSPTNVPRVLETEVIQA
ncbi:hypothetical protein P43SY_010445 [Pythium insidiosum]|uniref:Protein kinase domain-containing protein n=1 Tax=Pythium insidiosum TaxID=114742 RepID=A0AAD5Q560_PYTIN|nr:hypothetical protein P43SY_010445 [Pythium insidiosum]